MPLPYIPMDEVEEDLEEEFEEDEDFEEMFYNPEMSIKPNPDIYVPCTTARPKPMPLNDEAFVALEMEKDPFKCTFNAASFHHMSRNEMLSIFGQVLGSIDPAQKMDPMHEEIGDMIDRISEFLHVLGYRSERFSLDEILIGIEDGEHSVIVPIMAWLLRGKEEHQNRSYLGKYLKKMAIPLDLCADEDVVAAYDKYEKLIEQFKEVHKDKEDMICSTPVSELMEKIESLQRSLTNVTRKTEAIKSRIESYPGMEQTIENLGKLREETDRNERLRNEIKLEKDHLEQLVNHIKNLRLQRDNLLDKNRVMNPKLFLEREELELDILHKELGTRIPRNIRAVERKIEAILKIDTVDSEYFPSEMDIRNLRRRVQIAKRELDDEINSIEPKEVSDELVFARQRASGIRAKRLALESQVHALEEDLEVQKNEVSESRSHNSDRISAQKKIQGLTAAVQKKVGRFTKRKSALVAINNERSILASTKSILEDEYTESVSKLRAVEMELGIEGLFDPTSNPDKKNRPVTARSQALGNTSADYIKLSKLLKETQLNIRPLTKAINEARQKHSLITMNFKKFEKDFKGVQIKADVHLSGLEVKIQKLAKEMEDKELHFHEVKSRNLALQVNLVRAQQVEEHSRRNSRFPSFKHVLMGNLVEQERRGKALREEEKKLDALKEINMKQSEYWSNVVTLLKLKIRLATGNGSIQHTETPSQVTERDEPEVEIETRIKTAVTISNAGDNEN